MKSINTMALMVAAMGMGYSPLDYGGYMGIRRGNDYVPNTPIPPKPNYTNDELEMMAFLSLDKTPQGRKKFKEYKKGLNK